MGWISSFNTRFRGGKKGRKKVKKMLDKNEVICYYIEAVRNGGICQTPCKKVEKKENFFLTKNDTCGSINKLTAAGGKRLYLVN